MRAAMLVILFVSTAQAEVTASVALGKGVLDRVPFERQASIGYRLHFSETWFIKPELGGWLGGLGEQSWFIGAPVGLEVWIPNSGAYASAAVGPSRISHPDRILGGFGQFDCEFGLGLKTERANLGLTWKHFSSAGLAMPNLGRDFIGLQVGVEL